MDLLAISGCETNFKSELILNFQYKGFSLIFAIFGCNSKNERRQNG